MEGGDWRGLVSLLEKGGEVMRRLDTDRKVYH